MHHTLALFLVVQLMSHEIFEICKKILFQVELTRASREHLWGFSVEAELAENVEKQDELFCYISRVEEGSVAMQSGTCNKHAYIQVPLMLLYQTKRFSAKHGSKQTSRPLFNCPRCAI
jgi:hypothetical protein